MPRRPSSSCSPVDSCSSPEPDRDYPMVFDVQGASMFHTTTPEGIHEVVRRVPERGTLRCAGRRGAALRLAPLSQRNHSLSPGPGPQLDFDQQGGGEVPCLGIRGLHLALMGLGPCDKGEKCSYGAWQ
jgi:hypothetical protein